MAVGQVARETQHGVGWGGSVHRDWLPSVGYFSRLRETKGKSKTQKETTEGCNNKEMLQESQARLLFPPFVRGARCLTALAKTSHFLRLHQVLC